MSLCCLCSNTIQGSQQANLTVDGQRRALANSLLKLAVLNPRNCAGSSGIVCIKCEKDLENVEKLLSRISDGHRNRLPDVPMQQSQFTPSGCDGHSDGLPYNKAGSEPIQRVTSRKSNSETCDSKIANESLPSKRIRRPPKRYRDDETTSGDNYKNLKKDIKIYTYQNKLLSSSLSFYPKMAQLRTSNGNIVGDLVEVQRRGKHSRLRILCRECPEAFSQEKQFRQHLSKHMQGKENQFQLNEDEPFPFVENINFLYFCALCEKTFHDHSTVRRHFKTSHNEDRPFQCASCPAAFKYKTNLDYHTAKHLNYRNHQCPQCKKKFVLRYELQAHLRIHTGEKPFSCQICSMDFAHRSNLQKHRQAHSQNVNKIIKCHKCKTSFKNRICLRRHYETIHKICNHQGAESNKSHNDTRDSRNLLDIHEISKCMDNNNFISGEVKKDSNIFEETPKPSSAKISHNFIPQPIDRPLSIDRDATETNLISLIADNSVNSSDIGETFNSLSSGHLPHSNSNVEKSSNSHSSISPIIKVGEFDQVHEISSFNTASVDFVQTSQSSSIQWTNHTTNIKSINSAFITFLPKKFKIIKIPKINNSIQQDYYTKSIGRKGTGATNPHTIRNTTNINTSDDCTNMPLTYSTIEPKYLQKILPTTSLNDSSYLPSEVDNKFIKIPMTPYVKCLTVQNIPMDNNLESFSLDDLASRDLVPDITENLQIAADNGTSSCNNLEISKNQNHGTKDIKLTPGCDNEINKELVAWNHFQNSPYKSSIFKPFEIPNFNITNIDAKDKMIHKQWTKLEKSDDMRTANLEEGNLNQICENAEKVQRGNIIGSSTVMGSNNNKSPFSVFGDSSCPKMLAVPPDFSTTTVTKSPLKLKISPHSLLKPQLLPPSPRPKPIITNVEILPQLNLQQIQSPLLSNEDATQPSTPYVVQIPEEYKFQCSICWKYFKLKSALTKHLRTHTGEKPYKCNVCPKSYADASNYKKHKMLHTKAADDLNITRPKPPTSPALSNVTDPDPDGIEVMQTIQPFELSSGDSDDDMENYLWQDALQHSLMNKEIRENIRRNLKAINSSIIPRPNILVRRKDH